MTPTKEPASLFSRILATLDVLWLVGLGIYGVLQSLGLVPELSVGTFVLGVLLGVGGAAVLFGGRR